MNNKKTLTPYRYLKVLQEEYLIVKFRLMIYEHVVDIEYLKKVAELKKNRIVQMGKEHRLVTIFDSAMEDELIKLRFFNGFGIPIYKGLCSKDIFSYYSPNAEFLVNDEYGVTKDGLFSVKEVYLRESKVRVRRQGSDEMCIVPFTKVARLYKEK